MSISILEPSRLDSLASRFFSAAIELLKRHSEALDPLAAHLAVGPGRMQFASGVAAQLGGHYIGVGHDPQTSQEMRNGGFEVHDLTLGTEEEIYRGLQAVIADRNIASISVVEISQFAVNFEELLRAVGRLAAEFGAFVVVSAPNSAHFSLAFGLAFGLWDEAQTEVGADRHIRHFTAQSFESALKRCGLYAIETRDLSAENDDWPMPHEHPAVMAGSLLHTQLSEIRAIHDAHAKTDGFVRLCVTGPRQQRRVRSVAQNTENRPFLTVLTRTQGRRIHTLREVMTALAGQSDTDFEILLVGHRLTVDRKAVVEQSIADSPKWLRDKTRLILVEDGNRTRPLNVGFEEASGKYIAILDDDDMPMGHWVETFKALHDMSPGALLRSVALRQDVRSVTVDGEEGLRAEGPLVKKYPSNFDIFEHLRSNQTPPVAIAFPRGVFHDLGIRFDETLTTTEDWDYIMRTAAIVGVASSQEPTCIYRWWVAGESSRSVHDREEWDRNYYRILEKLDQTIVLWPKGTTSRIRYLLDAHDKGVITDQDLSNVRAELTEARLKIHRLERLQRDEDRSRVLLNALLRRSFELLPTAFPIYREGYVDNISFDGDIWTVSGWASQVAESRQCSLACIRKNGDYITDFISFERPDVKDLLGSDTSTYGFRFHIESSELDDVPIVCVIVGTYPRLEILRIPYADGVG